MTACERKQYPRYLRKFVKDARQIAGTRKVPPRLRALVKKHAMHMAKFHCTGRQFS